MAQPVQSVPMATTTISGSRQQVNLRDYLNTRVAPFLKKAITESLNAEPEYPLQWLGEHLIQQSLLYEGNPDKTGIKQRFVYEHNSSAPSTVPSAPRASISATTVSAPTPIVAEKAADDTPSTTSQTDVAQVSVPVPATIPPTTNGVDSASAHTALPVEQDTNMDEGLTGSETNATMDADLNEVATGNPTQTSQQQQDTEMEGAS